jgi:hypothetical protein
MQNCKLTLRFRLQVIKLIDLLKQQIGKAGQILNGERIPFEELSSDSDTDVSSQVERETSEVEDDSPWEVSSDSETDLPIRPLAQSMHGNGQSSAVSNSKSLAESPLTNINDKESRGITELGQLLDSIELSVTCLYKLPLRKPAAIDRLADRSTEEVSHYYPFDVAHVQNKFSNEQLDVQTAARLGKMITRRRQLLLYRERHKSGLRTDLVKPATGLTTSAEEQMRPIIVLSHNGMSSSQADAQAVDESRSKAASSRHTLQTKASTMRMEGMLHMDINNLLTPSVAESESKTSLAASEATKTIEIEVPPRPKSQGGIDLTRFECKYCFLTPYIRI